MSPRTNLIKRLRERLIAWDPESEHGPYTATLRMLANDEKFCEDLMSEILLIRREYIRTTRESNTLLAIARMELQGNVSDTNIVNRISDHFESDPNAKNPFNTQ